MTDLVADLLAFIDRAPTPYHAVAEGVRRLEAAGFRALDEAEVWDLAPGARHYVVRGDGSLAAFLIGVGIAVALSGALMGTLIPQLAATGEAVRLDAPDLAGIGKGFVVLVGTVCTLFAFDFTLSPSRRGIAGSLGTIVRLLGSIGRVFLTVALGVALAGALAASLSLFIGRMQYLIEVLVKLLGNR